MLLMDMDNDTIISFYPTQTEIIEEKKKPKKRSRKKIERLKTGYTDNVRMDIEELREINKFDIPDRTRSDIFLGKKITRNQKEQIHRSGKVYVRGHTKKQGNKIIVVTKKKMCKKLHFFVPKGAKDVQIMKIK